MVAASGAKIPPSWAAIDPVDPSRDPIATAAIAPLTPDRSTPAPLLQAQGSPSEALPPDFERQVAIDRRLVAAETLLDNGEREAVLSEVEAILADLGTIPMASNWLWVRAWELGGKVATRLGNYGQAIEWYQQAIDRRSLLPDSTPLDLVPGLNGLALAHRYQGNYSAAEQAYRRAIALYGDFGDPEQASPNQGILLDNLANLYRVQGNLEEATRLAQQAFAIFEATLEPNHPTIATSLNNLAALYKAQDQRSEAITALEQALQILEANLGQNDATLAIPLSNLAAVYEDQGDFQRAEPLYQRSLDLLQSQWGNSHPNTLVTANNLARLAYNQGNYRTSSERYRSLLSRTRQSLGDRHPDLAIYLKNSAEVSLALGDFGETLEQLEEVLALEEQNLQINLAALTEQQRRNYLATLNTTISLALTLNLQYQPNNPRAKELGLTALLQRKGRILDATSLSLQRLRQNLTPEDQVQFDRLNQLRADLASLLQQGQGNLPSADYQAQIASLEQEIQVQEKDLAEKSAAFAQETVEITLEAIQRRIPADAVLLEFFRYQPDVVTAPQGQRSAPARYGVYLVPPQGQPIGVDLGEAAVLEQRLDLARQRFRDPSKGPQQAWAIGRALHELLIAPLAPYLDQAQLLLISPDAGLNLLPFGALRDEEGRYLIQRYELSYLSSGRDLLRLFPDRSSTVQSTGPVILANPTYDLPENLANPAPSAAVSDSAPDRPSPPAQSRSLDFTSIAWSPLPGTAEEAAALQTFLPQATVITEGKATETEVKTLKSPEILHLATHGFFLPAEAGNQGNNPNPEESENPLLRSGLVFAGVNQFVSGEDDGVLTALEVTGLDLRGTELVVLSACETGLGEVTSGEGVYGLRRAFTLTGAESQVMSLWSVSDAVTRDLMTYYYQGLLQDRHGRSEALRQAQLQILADPGTTHPFYWAAFIAAGNWQPLTRVQAP
ncbi:MAG: CHAT domain-containing protein [Prochlorothrix sp.]